jgi:LmbE family N-acetylglucosaminyl deacetylase
MTRSRTLPILPTIAAFLLGAVVLSVAVGFAMRSRSLANARPLDVARLGQRVLVVAPHPDDEVLTAGGTIHRLLAEGAQVRVLIVTAGDGYYRAAKRLSPAPIGPQAYRHLGDVRHAESIAAAAELGLPASDVMSLGFPDSATAGLWDTGWSSEATTVGRTGSSSVPYPWAMDPGAPYTGQRLASEVVSVLRDFRPDTVISPDTRETHSDHAAVAAVALYALDEAGFSGTHLTAFVHFKRYPYPWAYLPWAALSPPPTLATDGSTWLTLPLGSADTQAKRAALERYRSQTAVADLAVYMRSFVRRNELFDERAAAVPATQPTDSRPASGTAGTVIVTPQPVIVSPAPTLGRIGSVRMLRGPQTVWIGLVSDAPIAATLDYLVDLRLVGGAAPASRLEMLVHGGVLRALSPSSDAVVPSGIATETDGRTLWMRFPASVLGGHSRAVLSTVSGRPKTSQFRTAWRDVAL